MYKAVSRGVTGLKNVAAGSAPRSIHVSNTRNLTAGNRDMTGRISTGLAGSSSSSSSSIQNSASDVISSTQTRLVSTHADNRQIQASPSVSR